MKAGTELYLTLLERGIAHQIKGPTTTNTKSHNSLFRSQRANGPVTFRLGDFRGTAICAQLTCRLEQLWSCSLVRCMQLCTRVSQPAFKPSSPAYQPDKITCTRIVRFPDLLQVRFANFLVGQQIWLATMCSCSPFLLIAFPYRIGGLLQPQSRREKWIWKYTHTLGSNRISFSNPRIEPESWDARISGLWFQLP